MIDFSKSFRETHGKPIVYQGRTLLMWDQIPLPEKSTRVVYRVLSTDSEWRQGIAVKTKGVLDFGGGQEIKRGWADLWEDNVDWEGTFTCYSKNGILAVKNIWDEGRGGPESWINGAAMWIEEIPNGRRYHCNDGHFDDDFDDIVFELLFDNTDRS